MIDFLPECFSEYRRLNNVCDGDKKSCDSDERRPCAIKDECKNFRDYLKNTSLELDTFLMEVDEGYVAKGDMKDFLDFCNKLKKKAKVDKRKFGPSKSAKVASKISLVKKSRKSEEFLLNIINFFTESLIRKLKGREYAVAGSVIVPGQLYVSNKIKKSGYITYYCKQSHGKDVAIVCLRLRKAFKVVDAYLKCDSVDWLHGVSKSNARILKATESKYKNYKIEIKGLKKYGLGVLAEAISELVGDGKILLNDKP